MVWKTRYSVRLPMHMIQPRKRSLWVWKLGWVKATAKACKRASSDGMIDHTEGGSWLLGECQRHGFNLKYTEVLPPFPSLEICESSDKGVSIKNGGPGRIRSPLTPLAFLTLQGGRGALAPSIRRWEALKAEGM